MSSYSSLYAQGHCHAGTSLSQQIVMVQNTNTSYKFVCFVATFCWRPTYGYDCQPSTKVWPYSVCAIPNTSSLYMLWVVEWDCTYACLHIECLLRLCRSPIVFHLHLWHTCLGVSSNAVSVQVRHLLTRGSALSFYSWFSRTTVTHLSCPLSSSDNLLGISDWETYCMFVLIL